MSEETKDEVVVNAAEPLDKEVLEKVLGFSDDPPAVTPTMNEILEALDGFRGAVEDMLMHVVLQQHEKHSERATQEFADRTFERALQVALLRSDPKDTSTSTMVKFAGVVSDAAVAWRAEKAKAVVKTAEVLADTAPKEKSA